MRGNRHCNKKSEDYDIPTERRLRRKKRMVGEMASDAGLTLKELLQNGMVELYHVCGMTYHANIFSLYKI